MASEAPNFDCARYVGRVAIVTGAAQGLGVAIARRLASEGASLVLADLQAERLERVAATLSEVMGVSVATCVGDLTERGACDRLVVTAVERFGRIDTLVNNAAVLVRKRLVDFDPELLRFAVEANLWPALNCCALVLPVMIERGYGRIVNIGGEAWRTGAPFHTALAGIGKGSLVGLTATLAGEVAADGITVNCVSPGFYEPDPADEHACAPINPAWTPPEVMAALHDMGRTRPPPIPRAGRAGEVAAAVAFLGAPEASYVTGQHLGVSGGLAML